MITGLFAALLALLYIRMSLKIVGLRRKLKISYGFGPQNEIIGPVSAHGNFAAYAPVLLVLLFLLEQSGDVPVVLIYLLGGVIFVGRLCHYQGVCAKKTDFKKRVLGMQLTIWPMILMSVGLILIWILGLLPGELGTIP